MLGYKNTSEGICETFQYQGKLFNFHRSILFVELAFVFFVYGFSIDVTADHLLQSFTKPPNIKGAAEAPSSINSALQ